MEETYFASTPKGLTDLLAQELTGLGAEQVKQTAAGVTFSGSQETAYRAIWWSRLAGRILKPLIRTEDVSVDSVYRMVNQFPWEENFPAHATFSVNAVMSKGVRGHGHYYALKVKDGIVDRFRERTGRRPSIEKENPDLRFHLALRRDGAVLSLDLGGGSLHRRGYRQKAGAAPIRENLAAALLYRANWPELSKKGGSLIDPMCGSGTLLVEGAMIAWDLAPGLFREQHPPDSWHHFNQELWNRLEREAKDRAKRFESDPLPRIKGFDMDQRALRLAKESVRSLGLSGRIQFQQKSLDSWEEKDLADFQSGLLICNPPYGQRLGNIAEAASVHARLGSLMRTHALGWNAAVITGEKSLGKHMGIRAKKTYKFFNGSLPCHLLLFDIETESFTKAARESNDSNHLNLVSPQAKMFANRLKKMAKQRQSWAKREGLEAYRIYDADLPDYNLAIDRYKHIVVVAEYQAPTEIPQEKSQRRLQEALLLIPEVLKIDPEDMILKVRKRQRGQGQYRPLNNRHIEFPVREYGLEFIVNPYDYLDTGLFNDHRLTRKMLGSAAKDKDFLNLFAYTGTATVYAAKGGAKSTVTVDLSSTYLDWARRNMAHNKLSGKNHTYINDDVLQWLDQCRSSFDLIFCDPPTFSNSKSMRDTFQVERDQAWLLKRCASLLRPGGELWFSTNYREFKLNTEAIAAVGLEGDEITRSSMPKDYERTPSFHRLWRFYKK